MKPRQNLDARIAPAQIALASLDALTAEINRLILELAALLRQHRIAVRATERSIDRAVAPDQG